MSSGNHYVYVLQCQDTTYYTGYTTDIEKRMKAHKEGKGAKYTRGRGPFSIVHEETYSTKREALQREYFIKQLSRKEKEKLIHNKGGAKDEYSKKLSK
ncbi:GIY-YIG nuclease family protein [Evansella sp. AB-P1]|uniref:GIY-YIG nuclease family protein n=1 Tax=Evansella sp. AB-P1 TaxID=3037653 RepID=UPI00242040A1|nr:GIY-YIG nuclease family protein [Evansella sp. AB-P1]MDG5789966.1 GIY-YIG nuclease family protein [Evansella sp. AB-P1]